MRTEENCKIDFVIDRHGLTVPSETSDSVDEYLVKRWTGEDGNPSQGYKQLTEWFNKRLLKQVYERNGRDTMSTRIESEYEALTGDDDLVRQEVMNDLEVDEIAADSLVEDMVSWSTMRRHLNECLGAEKESTSTQSNWEIESLDFFRNHVTDRVGSALRSLASKDKLPGAHQADVEVQIKLSCPECPTRVPVEDAVERGYVCKDHLDAVPTQQPSQPATSDTVSRALLPIGLVQSLLLDGLLLEESAVFIESLAIVAL